MNNPDWMVQAFAWFAIVLGIFTLLFRLIKPDFFRKLEMMQKAFGPAAGYLIHFLAYTVMPLVIGVGLLWMRHQNMMPHP